MFSPPTLMDQADAIMARLGIPEAEGLGPFLEARIRGEQVRWGHHWQAVKRAMGARLSGADPGPFKHTTELDLIAGARLDKALAAEWDANARSRFIGALLDLEKLGYGPEADTARSAYHRGFSPLAASPSISEIQVALKALEPVKSYAAKAATRALLEILAEVPGPVTLLAAE